MNRNKHNAVPTDHFEEQQKQQLLIHCIFHPIRFPYIRRVQKAINEKVRSLLCGCNWQLGGVIGSLYVAYLKDSKTPMTMILSMSLTTRASYNHSHSSSNSFEQRYRSSIIYHRHPPFSPPDIMTIFQRFTKSWHHPPETKTNQQSDTIHQRVGPSTREWDHPPQSETIHYRVRPSTTEWDHPPQSETIYYRVRPSTTERETIYYRVRPSTT